MNELDKSLQTLNLAITDGFGEITINGVVIPNVRKLRVTSDAGRPAVVELTLLATTVTVGKFPVHDDNGVLAHYMELMGEEHRYILSSEAVDQGLIDTTQPRIEDVRPLMKEGKPKNGYRTWEHTGEVITIYNDGTFKKLKMDDPDVLAWIDDGVSEKLKAAGA